MADLKVLQHYLTCAVPVEVECPGHGRGTLVGLPFGRMGEAVRATVHFHEKDPDWNEDIYDLEKVTPVLYFLSDRINEVMETPEWKALPDTMASLSQMAALVDKIRSMGIALGLPRDSYIVRNAWEAQPSNVEPNPAQPASTIPVLRKKSATAPQQGNLFS